MSALPILLGGAGNGEGVREGMCAPDGGGREPRANGAKHMAGVCGYGMGERGYDSHQNELYNSSASPLCSYCMQH